MTAGLDGPVGRIAAYAIRPLLLYARFGGRAPRAELCWFTLLVIGILGAAEGFDWLIFGAASWARPDFFGIVATVALVPPSIAVTARRLHDVDRSGWWQLLLLLPIIGWIAILGWCLRPGRRGSNAYGPDPLRRYHRIDPVLP